MIKAIKVSCLGRDLPGLALLWIRDHRNVSEPCLLV